MLVNTLPRVAAKKKSLPQQKISLQSLLFIFFLSQTEKMTSSFFPTCESMPTELPPGSYEQDLFASILSTALYAPICC